jgi:hypothetical protein
MKLTNAIGLVLSLTIFFVIGCQQMQNQITGKSADTSVSVSPDVVAPDAIKTGTVVIADTVEEWGIDEYVLNSAMITDDRLELNVSYGGGCEKHQFTLVSTGVFLEPFPVQLRVDLAHNANNDSCEAWLTDDYHFDLSAIKILYQAAYQQEASTTILLLEDAPNGDLVYAFAM